MHAENVMNHAFKEVEVSYSERDAIMYALGVNMGLDPTNEDDLQFLFEKDLKVLPGFAMTLGHPGFWVGEPELDITWIKALHAEQSLEMFKPIPASGRVKAKFRTSGIVDKGAEKGSIIYVEKTLKDAETDELIARVTSGYFCRADGGCGNFGEGLAPLPALPADASTSKIETTIDPRSALIYRLSGDYNPLHIMPDAAKKGGFEKPILHGLATLGIVSQQIVQNLGGGDPAKLENMSCRFTRPVYPGDKIVTEFWETDEGIRFRATLPERNEVCLDRGVAKLKA